MIVAYEDETSNNPETSINPEASQAADDAAAQSWGQPTDTWGTGASKPDSGTISDPRRLSGIAKASH
jgi:hypothetical protein